MAVAPGPGERLCRRGVYRPLAPRSGGKGLMSMECGFVSGAGAEWTGRSRYLKRSVCCCRNGPGGAPREGTSSGVGRLGGLGWRLDGRFVGVVHAGGGLVEEQEVARVYLPDRVPLALVVRVLA